MSSLEKLSDFCHQNRWNIFAQTVALPSSICVTLWSDYHLNKEWVVDSHSHYTAAVLATVFNTVIYVFFNVITRSYWHNFWEEKEKQKMKPERVEILNIRNRTKEYIEAQKQLEKAFQELRKIKIDIEISTKGLSGEVSGSQLAVNECQKKMEDTRTTRDEFVEKFLSPALDNILKEKDSAWFLEQSKTHKGSALTVNLLAIFSALSELNRLVLLSKTKLETSFNTPYIINALSPLLANINDILIKLNNNSDQLKKEIEDDTNKSKQLNDITLKAVQDDYNDSLTTQKTAEQTERKLENELSNLSSRMEELDRDKNAIALETAEETYRLAEQAYNQNAYECNLITKGSENGLSRDASEPNILTLKSWNDLFNLLRDIRANLQTATRNTQQAKVELDRAAHTLKSTLSVDIELIRGKLLGWVEEFSAKRGEIHRDQLAAVQEMDNLKSSRFEFGGIGIGKTEATAEEKVEQKTKAAEFFSKVLEIFDSVQLQYKKPDSQERVRRDTNSSDKATFPLTIPIWSGKSPQERQMAIATFKEQAETLKKQDDIFLFLQQLLSLLNTPPIRYEDPAFTRLFLSIKKEYYAALRHELTTSYITFKKAYIAYLTSVKNEEALLEEEKAILLAYEERSNRIKELESNESTLFKKKEDTKEDYEKKFKQYVENRGKFATAREQANQIKEKQRKLAEENSNIETTLTRKKSAVEAVEKSISELDDAIREKNAQIKINTSNSTNLLRIKEMLDNFLLTTIQPALLDKLKTADEEYQNALKAKRTADELLLEKKKAFTDGTQDFEDTQKGLKRTLESKHIALEEAEKQLIQSKETLNQADYDSLKLNKLSCTKKKCDSAIAYYRWKKDRAKDTTERMIALRLDYQRDITLMIQAKTELALKKQSSDLERARLRDLTEAKDVLEADNNKYKLMTYQLKRHRINQKWRINDSSESSSRSTTLEILQKEEKALYNFFRLKMRLIPTKNRVAQAHIERNTMKALLAFIDLFATKMYVDLLDRKPMTWISRHVKAELPTTSKTKETAKAEGNLELIEKPKPEITATIMERLKWHMETCANFNNLVSADTVQLLTKELDRDAASPKNAEGQLELTNFYKRLRNILAKFLAAKSKIVKHKIPMIEAKLELIKHLSTKPDLHKDYKGDFEKYQQALEIYRTTKHQKKIKMEELEIEYIQQINLYRDHRIREEKVKPPAKNIKDMVLEHPLTEKVSYLVPSLLLLGVYSTEKMNNFPIFTAHMSGRAGIAIWTIMAITHLCFQILFTREEATLVTKIERQSA
ncbi:MAG: hypothetical protein JSS10_01605 [Verrucomicrobia bacterium]|nr:hypothetical protein [Verrucomicrobiota bacterium]